MKKALIITNTASMVHLFNGVNMEILQNAGYEVHIACNFLQGNTASEGVIEEYKNNWNKKGVVSHHIGFLRSPFSTKSFQIYREVKDLIRQGDFDIIHCHTPIVSVFVRLAANKIRRKKEVKVVYTAHGFHFYHGSPKKNWLIYYPIEKLFGHMTDVLITINDEDYQRALKHIPAKEIYHINGVGIDVDGIFSHKCNSQLIRQELGISEDDILLVSVGELNNNKNHIKVIEAISRCDNKNLHYAVCGIGYTKDKLIQTAKEYDVENRVHLLGFQKDVISVLKSSDIFIFPSIREGLSVALMEAMASGLPIVASNIRGNTDLIVNNKGGFLCCRSDTECFAKHIDMLASDKELRHRLGEYNKQKIVDYDKSRIYDDLSAILLGKQECAQREEEVMSVEI